MSSRPSRLRLRALKRRGWVVLLCILGVGGIAYTLAEARAQQYSATATLVAPPSSSTISPGNPEQARTLARTYADVIGDDTDVERFVARQTRKRPSNVARGISASHRPETAVVTVQYQAARRSDAIKGAQAVADAVTGPTPATEAIAPRAMSVVRAPRRATATPVGFAAQVTLVVSSGAGPVGSLSADQANKLAKTYAGLIPADAVVIDLLRDRYGHSRKTIERNLEVANPTETALLEV